MEDRIQDSTLVSQRHTNKHRTQNLKQLPSPFGRTGSLTYILYLVLKWSFKLMLDLKSEDLPSSHRSPHTFIFLSVSLISSSFSFSGGSDPHFYLWPIHTNLFCGSVETHCHFMPFFWFSFVHGMVLSFSCFSSLTFLPRCYSEVTLKIVLIIHLYYLSPKVLDHSWHIEVT